MTEAALVRPESDAVEVGLSSWAALLLTSVGGKSGLSIVDLRRAQVTRSAVASAVSGQDLVIFFLHGQKNGLGSPTVYVDSKNFASLKGAVVIAFSCLAGDQLGPDAVTHGTRAFLGFDGLLTNDLPQPALFGHYVETSVKPLVLAGKSIDSVRSALRTGVQRIEKHYSTGPGKSDVNANLIWMAAHINWRGLVLHGDTGATI